MLDWINIVVSLGSIFIFLTIIYFIEIAKKDFGIVDIFWGSNFVVGALVSFIYTIIRYQTLYITQIVITAFILIWGMRLSIYIARRNIGKPEDRRYRELREKWGKNANLKAFFIVNMLQAVWASIAVAPIVVANSAYPETRPGWIIFNGTALELVPLILGALIWVTGFYFEVIGDWQLKKFLQNPDNKGKIIESGLWKYTRHPNYFGEIAMTSGLFIITISIAIENPLLWITIISPIIYSLLVYFVTGVIRTEKHMIKKPGFKEYMERTSILFPLPPKKNK
jgi:steroid 5-alpha reductase family enzyme